MTYHFDDERFDICVAAIEKAILNHPDQEGYPYVSFTKGFLPKHEGYKTNVALKKAKPALDLKSWDLNTCGDGYIWSCVLQAIKHSENLRGSYHTGYIEDKANKNLKQAEYWLYILYKDYKDEEAFNGLLEVFGRNYDLLAYLFFIKDPEKYLPCVPGRWQKNFEIFNIKTNCVQKGTCSWENYQEFIAIIKEARKRLQAKFTSEISLINAHSYLWCAWLLTENKNSQSYEFVDLIEDELSITQEQWEQFIQDENILLESSQKLLLKLYSYPGHAATCKRMGKDENKDPSSYISPATSFARRVLKALAVEPPKRITGEDRLWSVPFLGRYIEDNFFEWKLKPELVKAIEKVYGEEILQMRIEQDTKTADTIDLLKLGHMIKENPYPVLEAKSTSVLRYTRDPRIVAMAKQRANGVCFWCEEDAPFVTKKGEPYLEVHHIIPLAEGGADSPDNVIALCPNCHRKIHAIGDEETIAWLKSCAEDYCHREDTERIKRNLA